MSSRRALGILGVLAMTIAPVIAPTSARAEPTREDRAAATALFDEARKLVGEKKYAEACPKFEAAMRLDPGAGTLFNLSDCFEQIGRTASAWLGFRDVAAMAKADNRPDREKVARDRVAALEAKLSKVRLVVPPEVASAAGLTITRDGSTLPVALVGSPVPFDPGVHVIRVVAEGKEPWETKVTVPAQGGVTDVQVPALSPKKDPGPTVTAAPTAAPSDTASALPTSTVGPVATATPWVNPRPWQKPLGIAATAAGVVGLGVGVAFGVIAKGIADDSNAKGCDAKTNVCTTAEGLKLRSDAVDQGNIGTIIGVAGGVVGAAGLALWIFSPSAPAGSKSGSLQSVRVAAGPAGVRVTGQF